MGSFWGCCLISVVILLCYVDFRSKLSQIANALDDIADSFYDPDDDPDKEPIPEEHLTTEVFGSDIHLGGLKPLGKVIPFKKSA